MREPDALHPGGEKPSLPNPFLVCVHPCSSLVELPFLGSASLVRHSPVRSEEESRPRRRSDLISGTRRARPSGFPRRRAWPAVRGFSILVAIVLVIGLRAAETVEQPFQGVTYIERTETAPRPLRMHILKVDLAAPGIRFKLTPPSGALETVRQTPLEFLKQEHAQAAINGHFFLPFPSPDTAVTLVGFAASEGKVFSAFESPVQSYALVANVPALNIDVSNQVSVVHHDSAMPGGSNVIEKDLIWNAISGSAQIVTEGVKTIPEYLDAEHASGLLTPGGPNNYSNARSWYSAMNARTAIAVSRDRRILVLFTVDARGGSSGMTVGEVADVLIQDYGAFNALNLDGGGSTSLALENPATHEATLRNTSSDNPNGRAVGSNLALFALPTPVAAGR